MKMEIRAVRNAVIIYLQGNDEKIYFRRVLYNKTFQDFLKRKVYDFVETTDTVFGDLVAVWEQDTLKIVDMFAWQTLCEDFIKTKEL